MKKWEEAKRVFCSCRFGLVRFENLLIVGVSFDFVTCISTAVKFRFPSFSSLCFYLKG